MSHTTPAETDRLTHASLDRAGERYLAMTPGSDPPPLTQRTSYASWSDHVLAYSPDIGWVVAIYQVYNSNRPPRWETTIEEIPIIVTHWLPLPPAPESEG